MAVLLLHFSESGALLDEGEASIIVQADESGERYYIFGPDGEEVRPTTTGGFTWRACAGSAGRRGAPR